MYTPFLPFMLPVSDEADSETEILGVFEAAAYNGETAVRALHRSRLTNFLKTFI